MIEVIVTGRKMTTPDIVVLELSDSGGGSLPPYDAGAHIDLDLGSGLVRQYSLCDPWEEGRPYRIAVRRDPNSRGGSNRIHNRIDVGDVVRIGEPRNAFALDPAGGHHLLLAGGIGLTPLYCMAQVLDRGARSYELHVFARSPADLPFGCELNELRNVVCHFGLGPEQVAGELSNAVSSEEPLTHVYACGPSPFMALAKELAERQFGEDAYHQERFAADPVVDAGRGPDLGFVVELARSRMTLDVPADRSILDVLEDAGIPVMSSCREGVCGSCLTAVLEGLPEHRDSFLTSREKEQNRLMTVCVSRCLGDRLVLEI